MATKKKPPTKKTAKKKPATKKKPAPKQHPKREKAAAEVAKLPKIPKAIAAKLGKHRSALKTYALSLPEAYEDHPWGETVAKVNKKVFVFLGHEGEDTEGHAVLGFAVKLPESGQDALELPFTEPTGYGLGKAGWVTVRFPGDEEPPLDEFRRWIAESYRSVAPKKLAARLEV